MNFPAHAARGFARARAAPLALLLVLASPLVLPSRGRACDICAIYTATEMQESRTGLRAGLAEQISSLGTLQFEGEKVPNPNGERMTSAITQLLVGYRIHPRLGLQVALPWIHRDFRRLRDGAIDSGNEVGIGDLSLLASWTAWTSVGENSVFRATLLGGVKFPTGSSERLREELSEPLDPNDVRDKLNENMGYERRGAPISRPHAHLGPEADAHSGIHGHDLALGTGSIDPVFGLQAWWTWRRAVVSGNVQYILRTTGAYGYQYADELTGSLNPGVFAVVEHDHSLAFLFASTFEHKGRDRLDGQELGDTALTSVYVGPGLRFTRGSALSLDFAADLPVLLDNSSLQIVPDFRLRAGLVWRF